MKRIFLVFLILFLISSVSATNQTNSTFTDFQSIIDNAEEDSVVELDRDYTYAEGDSEITISKKLTINGNSHVLNGKDRTRIIKASNIVLNNIIFKNGNGEADDYGGAVSIKNSTINNCKFINNIANFGGGVYAENSVIRGCEFTGNRGEDGGGIYAVNSKITDSVFRKNEGDIGGGAYLKKSSLSNSKFIKNHASSAAGVFAQYSTISKSDFISNEGYWEGAVDLFHSTLKDCNFAKNKAETGSGPIRSHYSKLINNHFYKKISYKNDFIIQKNIIDNEYSYDSYKTESARIFDDDATGNPLTVLIMAIFIIPFVGIKR